MTRIESIDAHAGGAPLRLVTGGFPSPRGATMAERLEWAAAHADDLRRVVMLEPRGHADMCGAILTEPVSPDAHAGVLFMDQSGFRGFPSHGLAALVTIAIERRLFVGGDGRTVVLDTTAGPVRARARLAEDGRRVERVSLVLPPAFVLKPGLKVVRGQRTFLVDIAFGGAFFAIVDSEAAGLALTMGHLPELRRAGGEIRDAVESTCRVVHPADRGLHGVLGVTFTGPAGGGEPGTGDIRSLTIFAGGQVDRSPSEAGTAALAAVLDGMGLLAGDAALVHESVLGTRLRARVSGRTAVGGHEAVLAEVEGSAWVTGEHIFLADPGDPLREGFG